MRLVPDVCYIGPIIIATRSRGFEARPYHGRSKETGRASGATGYLTLGGRPVLFLANREDAGKAPKEQREESIDRARGEPLQAASWLHPRPGRRPVPHRTPAGRRGGCGPLYSERRPQGGKAGRRRRQRGGRAWRPCPPGPLEGRLLRLSLAVSSQSPGAPGRYERRGATQRP